jgi:hypothetical protein
MEPVLLSIRQLTGVTAAFVFNGNAEVLGQQSVDIYDAETLAEVSRSLVKAVESVQLQMSDWDTVSTQFEDGNLILRHLGNGPGGQPNVLAVVAEGALNAPFVAVALRVAVQKLKRLLDPTAPRTGSTPNLAGGTPGPTGSGVLPQSAPPPARSVPPSTPFNPRVTPIPPRPGTLPPSSPQLVSTAASSGLTWAGFGSGTGSSSIEVSDANAANYLTRCAKELARFVGPMAKIYVKEAVRRVSPMAPFALTLARQLVEDLATHVPGAADRASFIKAVERP